MDACMFVIARSVYRNRWPLVIAWGVVTFFLTPPALYLVLRKTVGMDKTPPAGTQSAAAMQVLDSQFHNASTKRMEMVVMRCKSWCVDMEHNEVAQVYANQIKDRVERFGLEHPGSQVSFQSYFDFVGHHQLLNPFKSKDQQSILLMWTWSVPVQLKQKAEDFVVSLRDFIGSIDEFGGTGAMEVKLTGNIILDHEMKVSIFDFTLHEVKTVWLPILILGYVLRSARLLLLALTPMLFEILVGFGFLYFVSLSGLNISYYALMIMLMLIMALSWDYALFMLTRYKAEREAGATVEQATVQMVAKSGSIVVVSGVVLSICWSVMLGLPDMFKTFGIAAASAIMVCATRFRGDVRLMGGVFAQLTFVAPVLAIFPWLGPEAGDPMEVEPLSPTGEAMRKVEQFRHGVYYQIGKFLTMFPCNVIAFTSIYVLMMPLTARFLQNFDLTRFQFTEMGHSFEMTMPRGSRAFNTSLEIVQDFDFDLTLMPVLIFATNAVDDFAQSAGTVSAPLVNENLFRLNCEMIRTLIFETSGRPYALGAKSFQTPSVPIDKSYIHSGPFAKKVFKDLFGQLVCPSLNEMNLVRKSFFARHVLLTQTSEHLDVMWQDAPILVSMQRGLSDPVAGPSPGSTPRFDGDSVAMPQEMVRKNAMLTVVNPAIDPLGPLAFDLERRIQEVLEEMQRYLTFSPAAVVTDLINVTSSALPGCFLVCVLICFSLIALWFNALLVPFKLFITVVVPVTWTYGAAFYVYEDGALSWLGIPGEPNRFADWTVPVFSLTFLIGLALDYDFFLFERVFEFRLEGFGDREAIQLGLSATGGTISAAGLILGLTFLALVLTSELPMMNQQGFVFVFSIVVDTFLVRTLVVPAMLSMSPWLNYWPRRMFRA
ncbi:Mycolic acid-containing lipids exporter MmpL11 [Durusdinium trenchii]|uniref:Mycolic acid-containing lipids exporter MmpL11 n=1 Tax=Durusdinium trenchii TaxID=1381693 RepID=A0ABP0QV54_9DINO